MHRRANDRRWSLLRAAGRGASRAVLVLTVSALPSSAQEPDAGGTVGLGGVQPPWRFSVWADNDAFNFWRKVTARPDEEYTAGDRVSFELARAPLWGKWFARRRAPCAGTEEGETPCLTTTFSVGHEMYTPEPGREPGVVADWRDERPYAAWLYADATGRVLGERALRAVGITLGVTGPPALGEFTQRTAHALTGVYSRDPIGWDTQIDFEPGVVITLRESRRVVARSASGRLAVDLIPQAGASLGNVLTAADVALESRLGVNLSHPWWMSGWRTRKPFEAYVLAGVRAQAVARNITLDGNTVDPTRRVERVPFVGEYSFGVGIRYREYVGAWRAVIRGREYETGPSKHPFSTLYGAIEVPTRGER